MCVLIVLRNALPEWPLVVAANRDELRDRPSEDAQILKGCAVAGRDVVAGGTWLGIDRDGHVCAITNRMHPPRSSSRSRGQLVMDFLTGGDTDSINTGGFNLLWAGADIANVLEFDGVATKHSLDNESHVICSHVNADDPRSPETVVIRKLLRRCSDIDELRIHLREIQSSPDGGICKHGEKFGTVSACFVAMHRDGLATSQFWVARGQPCEATWRDCSDLLRQLAKEQSAGSRAD